MNDTILKHYEVIAKYYPNLDISQLGLTLLMLGAIRASMGHERVAGTIENYIHTTHLEPKVRQCVDFIEREVLAIKKSKIDIDYWKRGDSGSFKRDKDLVEV